jgi:pyridoxal phosphate enzyme (YggS family)
MIINKLTLIENEIQLKIDEFKNLNSVPQIIAVSKTFPINHILPLINHGHLHFGENKIQEALEKWSDIKIDHKELKLHMVGKLQTNKVKFAVQLFDYIHSLDNLKLAKKISAEQQKQKKKLGIFIQINIGNETQKSGILPEQVKNFYEICINDLKLNIIGLMCLPPQDNDKEFFFKRMQELKKLINVKELSMGMSSDYIEATKHGATFVRIGSKIFGERI